MLWILPENQAPDLIIMDIQLPERSGLELTKDLKADEEKILEGGCDDYIAKPISVPLFLETVKKHLS